MAFNPIKNKTFSEPELKEHSEETSNHSETGANEKAIKFEIFKVLKEVFPLLTKDQGVELTNKIYNISQGK